MNNKIKLYWTLQLGGWAGYTLIDYISTPLFHIDLPYSGVYFFFSFISGVFITHYYRLVIIKWHWFDLSIVKLIRNIFLGAAAVTIVYLLMLVLFNIVMYLIAPYPANTSKTDEYLAFFYLSLLNIYAFFIIWTVLYFVFQYFENFQKVRYQQLLVQTQLKDATLLNLRNQINPHFLFNALNSIKSLTLTETEKARTAITLLSEILRYSLNSEHKTFVLLEEELSVVKDYLELEKIRFGNRLNYKIDVDTKTLQVKIPPLLLMTLVENSIKHGISRLKLGGDVFVSAVQQDNMLSVEIRNSGFLDNEPSKEGIGLKNTQQRLQMLYNQAASFIILQKDENTVAATLQIPLSV